MTTHLYTLYKLASYFMKCAYDVKNKEEAAKLLGVSPNATKEEIIQAHNSVLQRIFETPDVADDAMDDIIDVMTQAKEILLTETPAINAPVVNAPVLKPDKPVEIKPEKLTEDTEEPEILAGNVPEPDKKVKLEFKIPSDNIGNFREKMEKLSRKAKKLGLPPPIIKEIGEPEKKQRKDNHGNVTIYLLHTIFVDPGFSEIKVAGWQFVGTIQHTEEGNIVRNVGGTDLPTKYRSASTVCEHCNTIRNRKDTYVLFNSDTKEYKQVGRTCLQDFLGIDALKYAERAQYLSLIEDLGEDAESGGGGGGPKYYDLLEYVSIVAAVIGVSGWVSRKRSREEYDRDGQPIPATADLAFNQLNPFSKMDKIPITEGHVEFAKKAIEWAESIEGEDVSDYIHNIRLVARRGVIEYRDCGLAASIIPAYHRHLNEISGRDRTRKESEFVGNIGDKITVKVVVNKILPFDGNYGTTFMHLMTGDDGNLFVWSTGMSLEENKNYVLHGTIKQHKEYKGKKQTVLTRCKEIEVKRFFTIINGEKHVVETDTPVNAKKILKDKLGKLPRGIVIQEEPAGN